MTRTSSTKIGLIAFANDGGLGSQTRRLAEMIKPDKILVIDLQDSSPNKQKHLEWYKGFDVMVTRGYPKNHDINEFIQGLTHVFTCENPFNFYLIYACRQLGIKTYCQTNYEFCENLPFKHLPIPDKFLMPSYWKIKEMKDIFGESWVKYLPPPINPDEFSTIAVKNLNRSGKKRFLHIVGTLAYNDRNGTIDLIEAVHKSKGDYELVIKTQRELPDEYMCFDKRVSYEIGNAPTNADLYEDFDAMILPRRYGGLSLGTNEALFCGLPVMMTDISPNNDLLPKDWLVPAIHKSWFKSRAVINCYSADHQLLANKIDEWSINLPDKKIALQIARDNFSTTVLKPKYDLLFN